MWQMFQQVYRKDGLRGFTYGYEGQVFNAGLKAGLNRMVKERLQLALLALFLPARFKRMQAAALVVAAGGRKA